MEFWNELQLKCCVPFANESQVCGKNTVGDEVTLYIAVPNQTVRMKYLVAVSIIGSIVAVETLLHRESFVQLNWH